MAGPTIPTLVFDAEPRSTAAVISPASSSSPLSRNELKEASTRAADEILALLKLETQGIDGQPVVSMALPNGLGFVMAFLGVVARGAIAAPLNPAYTAPEFEFYLRDSKAGVLVVDSARADEAFPGVAAARRLGIPVCSLAVHQESGRAVRCSVQPVSGEHSPAALAAADAGGARRGGGWAPPRRSPAAPDTLALLLHTSGTTGRPKAVPLSHENLCQSALNVARAYGLGREDRGYLIQVLFHIHGIVASLLAPLVSGGSVVVPDRFDANVTWAEFSGLKCSWISGTPSALQMLLHAPKAGPDLGVKFLRSCSSPLLPSTFAELQRVFRCPVLEAYAMTENAHQMTTNTHDDARPGYVGRAAGTVRLRIYGDDPAGGPLAAGSQGEVCIAGPSVTRGYLDNPDANARAFFADAEGTRWFRTGDVGVVEGGDGGGGGGRLRLVGRRSEIINRGGEKISPPEVDEAMMLCAAPHVREAACFAVPDGFFGQEVEAAVVLAGGAPGALRDEAELQRRLGERLAPFKIPKRIHFFEGEVPKGPTGKIQRAQLAKKLGGRAGGPANGRPESLGVDQADQLPERIARSIAENLRVDLAGARPEVTLLELGADSMNLTRLLGDLRHLGCNLTMDDVMLNPTVQQVIDMCVKSLVSGGSRSTGIGNDSAGQSVEVVDVPAPFSLLSEFVIGAAQGAASLDDILAAVAEQTRLRLDQVEDVLPLSPEAKWLHDGTVTNKWGLKDTHFSTVILGAPIQDSIDVDRLKWAFSEAAKVEPLPRSYFAQEPGTGQWLQVIAKPDVAPLNWHEWSVSSEDAAYDKLQRELEAMRCRPGVRGSKYVLVHYPNERGEMCRGLYFYDSHVLTDNTSRSRLRDNVIKLYLGQATIDNLPQKPLPTSVFVRDLLRRGRDNYASKAKFWKDDEMSHAVEPRPAYIPPPEAGLRPLSQWTVHGRFFSSVWTGDLRGLTVAVGMTAPTLVQVVLPLALAAYERQGTGRVPGSVCFAYGSSSRSPARVPGVDQARGLGMFFSPFRFPTALAARSLWLHARQAALKIADLDAHRLLVESADAAGDLHVEYTWRELPAGSLWASAVEAGPERFSSDFYGHTTVLCVRLDVDTLMLVDGEAEGYVRWRKENGYPVRLIEVLRRCLTFLCENKDDIVSLTLDDLVQAVWSVDSK